MVWVLIVALSSLLWRVRGGLRIYDKKIPMNKVWYAVGFSSFCCYHFTLDWQIALMSFIACYTSYQLYGWGLYIGRLLSGGTLNPNLNQYRECELIDDLLYSIHWKYKGKEYYLYQFPKAFGFFGTCLTGFIITFIWSLVFTNIWVMFSGLAMGVCYWLGGKLEKVKELGKAGWNWGEWIFGAYLGLVLGAML